MAKEKYSRSQVHSDYQDKMNQMQELLQVIFIILLPELASQMRPMQQPYIVCIPICTGQFLIHISDFADTCAYVT